MLNEYAAITQDVAGNKRAAWTAPYVDDRSWLFANGILISGPMAFDAAARYALFLSLPGKAVAVDIHDLADGIAQQGSTYEAPNNRPLIRWRKSTSSDTTLYRIYRQHEDESAETMILEVPESGTDFYAVQLAVPLVDGWHFFRVEAVDAYGNESTVDAWPYLVFDLPEAPSVVAAEIDGGNLTITITP